MFLSENKGLGGEVEIGFLGGRGLGEGFWGESCGVVRGGGVQDGGQSPQKRSSGAFLVLNALARLRGQGCRCSRLYMQQTDYWVQSWPDSMLLVFERNAFATGSRTQNGFPNGVSLTHH
jgi:hypothetical protein